VPGRPSRGLLHTVAPRHAARSPVRKGGASSDAECLISQPIHPPESGSCARAASRRFSRPHMILLRSRASPCRPRASRARASACSTPIETAPMSAGRAMRFARRCRGFPSSSEVSVPWPR